MGRVLCGEAEKLIDTEILQLRKVNLGTGSGINKAKKEATLSLSKRKLAVKAKIIPPKTTYATPIATTVTAVLNSCSCVGARLCASNVAVADASTISANSTVNGFGYRLTTAQKTPGVPIGKPDAAAA